MDNEKTPPTTPASSPAEGDGSQSIEKLTAALATANKTDRTGKLSIILEEEKEEGGELKPGRKRVHWNPRVKVHYIPAREPKPKPVVIILGWW